MRERSEYNRAWREANAEKVLANQRRWKAANPDLVKANSRRAQLKDYGLTPETFDATLAAQGGVCAGCGEIAPRWHIDHDHTCCPTRKTCGTCFRAILCQNCNIALGCVKDSSERLLLLVAYLQRFLSEKENQ